MNATDDEHHTRQTINGVTYDTATAKVVAVHGSHAGLHLKLCKTKTARWFTQYAKDGFISGIRPITALEALVWLHRHDFAGLVEEHFPGVSAWLEHRGGRTKTRRPAGKGLDV